MASISAAESPRRNSRDMRGRQVATWFLSLALATAGMWFVLQHRGMNGVADRSTASTHISQPVAQTAGQRTLDDLASGYRLAYPSTWSEVGGATSAGADGHVLRINGQNAFSIQTFPLEHAVPRSNISDMRAVTDAILSSPSAHLTVLEVRQVEVAGLPAIYYLYYFPAGKQRGIHAHYFIFDGTRMHTLIFQVVPATDFGHYASQFDRVVASFKPADP